MTKHVHHDLIVKWAADSTVTVECRQGPNYPWQEISTPSWVTQFEYRIKPRLVKKERWIITSLSQSGRRVTPLYEIYASEQEAKKAVEALEVAGGSRASASKYLILKTEWEEEEQV